ncbi:hypothetical protein PHYPO_G00150600, partial [Pangasianodon hypophthalmus]
RFCVSSFVVIDRKKSSESLAGLCVYQAQHDISSCACVRSENCMMGHIMSGHEQEMPNPLSETAACMALSFMYSGTDLNMDHPAHFTHASIFTNKRLHALMTEFQHPDCNQWSIQRLEKF